jgi:hypothetical protein
MPAASESRTVVVLAARMKATHPSAPSLMASSSSAAMLVMSAAHHSSICRAPPLAVFRPGRLSESNR